MKRIFLALAIVSGTMLIGCKSGSNDPKGVLAEFFEALSEKDMDKARSLATEDSKTMLDLMDTGMKMAKDTASDEKFSPANLQYGEVKIDGDRATVPVTEKSSGETLNYTLKKEKGQWKVAFDKETMMTMGMEKMNEKGMDAGDMMDNTLDEIQQMDQDSIKNMINESLKEMESATQ